MDLDQHTAVAVEELLRRRLGVTSQVLSVHAVPEPTPAAVDTKTSPSSVFFFFSLPGELYHFWVRIGRESANLEFAGVTPLSTFELLVVSDAIEPDEVSRQLGVQPARAVAIGESPRPGSQPLKQNVWSWQPIPRVAGFFETRLEAFLFAVLPLAPRIRELRQCHTELSIASYQWSAWPDGFHMSPRVAVALAELGASLDIDLYCSGPAELGA